MPMEKRRAPGVVQTCNVKELFKRLVKSIIQPSSIVEFCFHKPHKQALFLDRDRFLVEKLVNVCLDVVLLRQWEWKTNDTQCISQCLGIALSLHYQGQSIKATSLAAAMTWLLQENADLIEGENLLQFLFLLSSPSTREVVVDSPVVGEGQLYPHYSSAVFERLNTTDFNNSVATTTELFNSTPGSGFAGFMARKVSDESLFGGLTHSTSTDLNDPLGLPRLPSDHKDVSLLPKLPPVTSAVLTTPTPEVSPITELSGLALFAATLDKREEVELLVHMWEGWDTSLPFFCDAVPPASKHASFLLTSQYASMAGIPSPPPSCDTTLLPEQLASAIDDVPPPPLQPVMDTDAVLFSVSHTLYSLLVCCRTALLHPGPSRLSPLQAEQATHHILPVTRFVLRLIELNAQMKKFEVMDNLFQQSLQLQGTAHYLLLLSMLSQTLLSYFKTVEQWVYYGILDTTQWIGIQTDLAALEKRDETYWTSGYAAPEGCTPPFLHHLSHHILTCGKALNLLRVCLPKHALCVGHFAWPHLQLVFTAKHLQQLQTDCEVYRSEVSKCCQAMSEQTKQQHLAREQEVHSKQVQARQAARLEGERVREMERAQREADLKRKRSLVIEQKEEMERARALRSQQLAEEKRADMVYLASLEQRDHQSREREALLEQAVRQELEDHYRQLEEEAEQRRARAEWRLARLKLASTREAFWKEQSYKEKGDRAEDSSEATQSVTAEKGVHLLPSLPTGTGHSSHLQQELSAVSTSSSKVSSPHPSAEPDTVHPSAEPDTVAVSSPHPSAEPDTVALSLPHISAEPGTVAMAQNQVSPAIQTDSEKSARSAVATGITGVEPAVSWQPMGSTQSVTATASPADPTVQLEDTSPALQGEGNSLAGSDSSPVSQPDLKTLQEGVAKEVHQQSASLHTVQERGHPRLLTTRGHAPPSTIQHLFQQEMTSSPVQEMGDPKLVSTRGHAPPTSIQKLFSTVAEEQCKPQETDLLKVMEEPKPLASPYKYRDDFLFDGAIPLHDVLGKIVKHLSSPQVDVEFLNLFPLPALLANSIDTPLLTQCSLVNSSLLDYFYSHCQLHHHFLTLKRFLLLEDGEFGHALSTKLCEKLSCASDWRELASPSFLNPLLVSSLEASLHCQSVSSQLSFSLKYQPHTIHTNAVKALDFLELKYKVSWPCNIVITSGCLHRYNKVLHFLLELKRSSWVLKRTFHWLKNCCVLDELKTRQLQTYRHEFQHFVNIMHGYISSQLFGLTWEEFQAELSQHCGSLDDVIQAHNKFIDKAIFRCLLSKKARPVMNLIYDLLASILTFSSHTQASVTAQDSGQHHYMAMCHTYRAFRDTVRLLISVLGKLIARGYQPHLEELLLRLNFNSFY